MLSLTTKPGCAGGFERQTAFAGEANEVIRPGTVVTAPLDAVQDLTSPVQRALRVFQS